LDVGGIGYASQFSLSTYSKIKDEEQLGSLTFFCLIKEDAHTLYGFKEEDGKSVFF